jgi:hypothetical protein
MVAATASAERLARALRERKRRSRALKPTPSPEPTATPAVSHAERRDAAPFSLTPLVEIATASSKRLVRVFGEWRPRLRREGRARSPQPAVPGSVENPKPGATAPSVGAALIQAVAGSTDWPARALRAWNQQFRREKPARLPGPTASPAMPHAGPRNAAPSIVKPLMEFAAGSGERLVETFRVWNQRFRWEGPARSSRPAGPEPVENPEPAGTAPSIVTPLIAA